MRQAWISSLLLPLALVAPPAHGTAPLHVDACVGPAGHLRVATGGCAAWERPLAWQRGGGVWLHDAEGRPLGRSIASFGAFRVLVEPEGLEIGLDPRSGFVLSSPREISFDAPDCQGHAFGGRFPGDILATSEAGPLFVVTERVLENVVRRSRRIANTCQNLTFQATFARALEVVPFEGELPFALPVPVPLGFGTGPLGDGPGERIDACAGPHGRLRIPRTGLCRRRERALRWQRSGGLRVYDGLGREVGAAIGPNAAGAMGILLGPDGAWIEPEPLTGALPRARTFHTAPGCGGDAFVAFGVLGARPWGQVYATESPDRFLVSTAELVTALPIRSLRDTAGACSDQAGVIDGQRLVPSTGPLPELPLPVPLVVGFPGSPIANPAGPAVEPGLQLACAGPRGRLRAVEEGEACRRSERALRWPRRGGLRALDADGNDLGAFLANPDSPSVGDTLELVDDVSGLRFGVRHVDGEIGDPVTRGVVPVEVSFDGPFCTGTPFRRLQAAVGLVFRFSGPPLWVGTRMDAPVERSKRVNAICVNTDLFQVPLTSTVVQPFTGVLPFPTPVATRMRVGPGN